MMGPGSPLYVIIPAWMGWLRSTSTSRSRSVMREIVPKEYGVRRKHILHEIAPSANRIQGDTFLTSARGLRSTLHEALQVGACAGHCTRRRTARFARLTNC